VQSNNIDRLWVASYTLQQPP